MTGYLNRADASRHMKAQQLDAMILTQPETFRYATGCRPGVSADSRRAGPAMLLVPADPNAPVMAIVGDGQVDDFRKVSKIADVRTHPIWFDTATLPEGAATSSDVPGALQGRGRPDGAREFKRPEQFRNDIAFGHLSDVIAERGMQKARIGLEFCFVPVNDMANFQSALPDVKWADVSRLVERLRCVKTPAEIEILKRAAKLTEAGIAHLRANVALGHTADDIGALWREGCLAASLDGGKRIDSMWSYISVGPIAFGAGRPVQSGDTIKLDLGAVVEGYSSDIGRTWIAGKPSAAQQAVFDGLEKALESVFPLLKPGTPITELHRAATESMRKHGFTNYVRGHYGHSIGASLFTEEWPFLSAESEEVLQENMALALEAPYYIEGLGSFIIEDNLMITANGFESMYTNDRGFVSVCN